MGPRGKGAGGYRRLEVDALGVLGATGMVLVVLGLAQLLPAAAALWLGGPWGALLLGALGTCAAGLLLLPLGRSVRQRAWRRRESLAVATLSWVVGTLGGATPFVVTGACGPVDAWFESVSGLTTTGASVFADVDAMVVDPRAALEGVDGLDGRVRLSGAWLPIAPGRAALIEAVAAALGPDAEVRVRRDPAGRVTGLGPAGPRTTPWAAPLHLWRALCHWLGGAGIVLLVLVLVPWFTGEEALRKSQQAEASFLTERYRGSTRATLRGLLVIYVVATAATIATLVALGVGAWEATLHGFSAIATGGFSPYTASLGTRGAAVQLALAAFMIVGALNFAVMGRSADDILGLVRRERRAAGVFAALAALVRNLVPGLLVPVLRHVEVRSYLVLLLSGAAAIGALLVLQGDPARYGAGWAGVGAAAVDAAFNVVSLSTTTGFFSVDWERWPAACQGLLLALMVIGGCSGSTAGGIKVRRLLLLVLFLRRELVRLPRPSAVLPIKLGGHVVPEEQVREALGYVSIYLLLAVITGVLVAASGTDRVSAGTSAVASLGSIGPGFGLCGPTGSFNPFAPLAKLVLAATMILGRLEIVAPLTVALPSFWLRRGARAAA